MAMQSTEQNTVKTIRFIRRGEVVTLGNVPPTRTLLEVLREDLGLTGTKEGCGEGDCGACTVVLGETEDGTLRYRAINSCIRLAHSIDGMALWTVEDIAPTLVASRTALRLRPGEAGSAAPAGDREEVEPTLHPAQQAMLENHASQCGFCTPGFVMSLFGMYQNHVLKGETITRALAQEELSGNLCRCTGYRPILDAAQQMVAYPAVPLDEVQLVCQLESVRPEPVEGPGTASTGSARTGYMSPVNLDGLLRARAAHPDAQIVAGCTDVGLWVTKQHMQFGKVLDLTKVRELRRIEHYPHHIAIGAAVPLTDAFAALVKDRPQLHAFAARFAGLPVRNSGTLGGNVANGSPIGDSMPLLIALGANVVLMSMRAGQQVSRELPLEQLYTGYRKNVMAADEVLAWIKVPRAVAGENAQVYKISKRYDDDISAVCLAINLSIEDGIVAKASIGAGGVAATPVRALKTEAALAGKPWTAATVQQAMATLRAEFSPISDMRASSTYRVEVLGNLLQRYWLESQGMQQINLQSFRLEEAL
ncbi:MULTISPECIES: xanthine dehydrogenase small subunit [Polaromonas]|uniref:Xanthine dehydrogenase small subunit n=1 Tax=Polaromonas aquatica TaxID=332657 RepID=A0ABW1U3C0_9BURK